MTEKKQGIYLFVDRTVEKFYVGSSVDLNRRFREHHNQLVNNAHPNKYLQRAFNQDHDIEVVPFPLDSSTDIIECEQFLIDQFIDKGVLYNIARDAVSPNKGRTASEETIQKMRLSQTGKKHSPETLALLSEIAKARGMPRSAIEAGIEARRGKSLSPEHIEKVRATSKERMTPEAREHLRQVNLGINHTPEDIQRMKDIKRQNSGRPVVADGQLFNSVSAAAEHFGIDPSLVRVRINSTTGRFKDWNYV